MQPAFEPRDRVLVSGWAPVRVGDAVVFRRPDARASFALKRVVRITPSGDLDVLGDNANASSDSRHFGPVPARDVIGRVVYRYAPPERRGRPDDNRTR